MSEKCIVNHFFIIYIYFFGPPYLFALFLSGLNSYLKVFILASLPKFSGTAYPSICDKYIIRNMLKTTHYNNYNADAYEKRSNV